MMGAEARLFKSEEHKNRMEAAGFLQQLAGKISSGRVVLSQGPAELELNLPNNLILEVQVEDEDKGTKGTRHSLEVKMKWYDNDEGGLPPRKD